MNATAHAPAGIHDTAEQLIRHAAKSYAAAGIDFPAARVSKWIRAAMRDGVTEIDGRIDQLVSFAHLLDKRPDAERADLLRVLTYADHTGEDAANNVDRLR